MSLLVQKYGGSSVANLARIELVAARVAQAHAQGHQLVVVVSAMAGETDRLINLAKHLNPSTPPSEYDAIVATGEQVSAALLAIALAKLGIPARSFSGWQAGIQTNNVPQKARITLIEPEALYECLDRGEIPVVAGFQGVDEDHRITTLGRGGSDTTAVALAAALQASECQIYTDVEGVFTADPRIVSQARLLPQITFAEMLELASLGANVLQIRAVEFAGKYQVPLRVAATFGSQKGTLITYQSLEEASCMEQAKVSGIAFSRREARLSLHGIPNQLSVARDIIEPLAAAHIDIDMIIQNISGEGKIDFSFTVSAEDFTRAQAIMSEVVKKLGGEGLIADNKVAKVSVVGVGMRSHPEIASTLFITMAQIGVPVHLISTSEIKISVIIDEQYTDMSVRALHAAFELEQGEKEPLIADSNSFSS